MNVGVRQRRFRKERYELCAPEMSLDLPLRSHDDAATFERPPKHHAAVVARQCAVDLDGLRAFAARKMPCAVSRLVLAQHDACVACQIVWYRGLAMPRHVVRRRAYDPPV